MPPYSDAVAKYGLSDKLVASRDDDAIVAALLRKLLARSSSANFSRADAVREITLARVDQFRRTGKLSPSDVLALRAAIAADAPDKPKPKFAYAYVAPPVPRRRPGAHDGDQGGYPPGGYSVDPATSRPGYPWTTKTGTRGLELATKFFEDKWLLIKGKIENGHTFAVDVIIGDTDKYKWAYETLMARGEGQGDEIAAARQALKRAWDMYGYTKHVYNIGEKSREASSSFQTAIWALSNSRGSRLEGRYLNTVQRMKASIAADLNSMVLEQNVAIGVIRGIRDDGLTTEAIDKWGRTSAEIMRGHISNVAERQIALDRALDAADGAAAWAAVAEFTSQPADEDGADDGGGRADQLFDEFASAVVDLEKSIAVARAAADTDKRALTGVASAAYTAASRAQDAWLDAARGLQPTADDDNDDELSEGQRVKNAFKDASSLLNELYAELPGTDDGVGVGSADATTHMPIDLVIATALSATSTAFANVEATLAAAGFKQQADVDAFLGSDTVMNAAEKLAALVGAYASADLDDEATEAANTTIKRFEDEKGGWGERANAKLSAANSSGVSGAAAAAVVPDQDDDATGNDDDEEALLIADEGSDDESSDAPIQWNDEEIDTRLPVDLMWLEREKRQTVFGAIASPFSTSTQAAAQAHVKAFESWFFFPRDQTIDVTATRLALTKLSGVELEAVSAITGYCVKLLSDVTGTIAAVAKQSTAKEKFKKWYQNLAANFETTINAFNDASNDYFSDIFRVSDAPVGGRAGFVHMQRFASAIVRLNDTSDIGQQQLYADLVYMMAVYARMCKIAVEDRSVDGTHTKWLFTGADADLTKFASECRSEGSASDLFKRMDMFVEDTVVDDQGTMFRYPPDPSGDRGTRKWISAGSGAKSADMSKYNRLWRFCILFTALHSTMRSIRLVKVNRGDSIVFNLSGLFSS